MKYIICIMLAMFLGCGKQGPMGPAGSVGLTGPIGQVGPSGTPGSNADSFTPIQLCSACVDHYPDTFAEVVFCYEGNLYGTYSANGGFSSELPQGEYSSNGINCSCIVTIGSNCSIT